MSTFQVFGKMPLNSFGGETAGEALQMDWLSDVFKVTLHTVTYAPNIDTNEVYADATNELSTANGYTNGGFTVTTSMPAYTSAGNIGHFTIGDASWTASGGSLVFQIAVLRDSTIATGPLIGYIDCGAQTITTGNTFTIHCTGDLFTATVT